MRSGLSQKTIERILGGAPKYTIAELEEKFPNRNLPDGAFVTRFAPSPTGYMHIGGLYGALIDCKLARQTGGVFMLRIGDTDTKREVADAVNIIINSLNRFGLKYNNDDAYGPYHQSQRRDIYHSVAADLLARGLAYPCFLTANLPVTATLAKKKLLPAWTRARCRRCGCIPTATPNSVFSARMPSAGPSGSPKITKTLS